MKQFIKINILNQIGQSRVAIINTQMIQSIGKSPFDFWIVAMSDDEEFYRIDQYTYDAIVRHMAYEIADLTPPKDHTPPTGAEEETTKLFEFLATDEYAAKNLKSEFYDICDSGETWLWEDHENELFHAIHKYTTKYAHGTNLAAIDYHKLIGTLARHWGLERND